MLATFSHVIPALLWIAYMVLIGYAFVSMSRQAKTWRKRVLLALAALVSVLLASYYVATRIH